jgi:hypothetical protein
VEQGEHGEEWDSQAVATIGSGKVLEQFEDTRAVSQLLWPDKDREVWFSLKENHEKAYGSGLHQLRNSFNPAEWGLPSTNEDFCGLDYKPVIRGNVSP